MTAPTGQPSPFPVFAWPTETFETGRRYVYLNDEGIEVIHHPAAHTDGDAAVFFRRSDVIVAGDIFDTTRFPVIDLERGGSLQGTIHALNRMIATAIPSLPDVSREVGTSVIPGHGHVGDQFDLLNYRDMLVIVRDHVLDLIKAGMTLDKSRRHHRRRVSVGRYGSDSGSWTTDDFIEAVFKASCRQEMSRLPPRHDRASCLFGGREQCWRSRARCACSGPRRRAPTASAPVGAHRSHWQLGVLRHRRLALSDDDAAERRLHAGAAHAGGSQTGGRVESGGRRGRGQQCKAYGGAAIMRVPATIPDRLARRTDAARRE